MSTVTVPTVVSDVADVAAVAAVAVAAVAASTECNICCEDYNKSDHKKITCSHCAYESCVSCNKRVILESIHEPHCINCRKTWSLDFMNRNFTQAFITKEYRTNRENVYFKEEETHFPGLLAAAERQKKLNEYDDALKQLAQSRALNEAKEDQLVSEQRVKERELKSQVGHLDKLRQKVFFKSVSREKRTVVMKCPIGECKGFMDAKFHCGLCDTHVCPDCHVKKTGAKDDAHVCNEDDVATVSELARNTKPCPNEVCRARIYKTDGCDQMFCVQCHTAFSWRTGQVETGVIHNPHYFDALRAGNIHHQRHVPHQGGCGVMRRDGEVRSVIISYAYKKMSVEEWRKINDELFAFYQQIVHHRAVTLHAFTRVVDRDDERIKFMVGTLDEKKFKQRLYVHRQSSLRRLEEQQIIDTYVNMGEEIFRTLTKENLMDAFTQLRTLQDITFAAIVDVDKKYQHKGLVKPTDIKR
jgi:hypothetical protein